jgi:hypothetical protein
VLGPRASLQALNSADILQHQLPGGDSHSLSVPVADIKAIVTGKDCPHMKEKSALKQNKVRGGRAGGRAGGQAGLNPSPCP